MSFRMKVRERLNETIETIEKKKNLAVLGLAVQVEYLSNLYRRKAHFFGIVGREIALHKNENFVIVASAVVE